MASYAQLAKKLQNAINQRSGVKLLINTQQWYSSDKGRTVTCYVIKQSMEEASAGKKKRKKSIELFKTYSQVQMVLWLRDYWYTINGWEVPTDNETWEEVKQKNAYAEGTQS